MYLILLIAIAVAGQPSPEADSRAQPTMSQPGAIEAKPVCRETRSSFAGPGAGSSVGTEPPPRARRLDELPQGNLELAVQREVDGCIEPAIIRQGLGAMARPERR